MTSPDNDIPNPSLAERRRAIFARVVGRLAARGTPVDADPRFHKLADEWINGRIEMADVARGYAEIRRTVRHPVDQSPTMSEQAPAGHSQERLFAELEKIIGMYEPTDR